MSFPYFISSTSASYDLKKDSHHYVDVGYNAEAKPLEDADQEKAAQKLFRNRTVEKSINIANSTFCVYGISGWPLPEFESQNIVVLNAAIIGINSQTFEAKSFLDPILCTKACFEKMRGEEEVPIHFQFYKVKEKINKLKQKDQNLNEIVKALGYRFTQLEENAAVTNIFRRVCELELIDLASLKNEQDSGSRPPLDRKDSGCIFQ